MPEEQDIQPVFCLKCGKELKHVKMTIDESNEELREGIKTYLMNNPDPSIKDFYLRKCIQWVAYCETCNYFYEWKTEPLVANMRIYWNNGKTKYDKIIEYTLEEIKRFNINLFKE